MDEEENGERRGTEFMQTLIPAFLPMSVRAVSADCWLLVEVQAVFSRLSFQCHLLHSCTVTALHCLCWSLCFQPWVLMWLSRPTIAARVSRRFELLKSSLLLPPLIPPSPLLIPTASSVSHSSRNKSQMERKCSRPWIYAVLVRVFPFSIAILWSVHHDISFVARRIKSLSSAQRKYEAFENWMIGSKWLLSRTPPVVRYLAHGTIFSVFI